MKNNNMNNDSINNNNISLMLENEESFNSKGYLCDVGIKNINISNEGIVSRHGLKVAKGLSDNGVIPVFKHFPGHGSTDVDSHKDLPIINSSKEELLNSSIIPFKKAIEEDAKVIMVGHLSVPSITNNFPIYSSDYLLGRNIIH